MGPRRWASLGGKTNAALATCQLAAAAAQLARVALGAGRPCGVPKSTRSRAGLIQSKQIAAGPLEGAPAEPLRLRPTGALARTVQLLIQPNSPPPNWTPFSWRALREQSLSPLSPPRSLQEGAGERVCAPEGVEAKCLSLSSLAAPVLAATDRPLPNGAPSGTCSSGRRHSRRRSQRGAQLERPHGAGRSSLAPLPPAQLEGRAPLLAAQPASLEQNRMHEQLGRASAKGPANKEMDERLRPRLLQHCCCPCLAQIHARPAYATAAAAAATSASSRPPARLGRLSGWGIENFKHLGRSFAISGQVPVCALISRSTPPPPQNSPNSVSEKI